MIMNFGVR